MIGIEILHPGVFTTLQDAGRPGFAYFAVPRSGPVDPPLARRANRLVGNHDDAATFEFQLMGATLRFDHAATIALTGADLRWRLGERELARDVAHAVDAGAVLEGGPARDGRHGYLAVRGEVVAARQLDSVAMHARVHGRLGRGAIVRFDLRAVQHVPSPNRRAIPVIDRPGPFGLALRPGPQWDALTASSQQALLEARWSVDPQSDRVGTRLRGPRLEIVEGARFESVPVWIGCVQVDPSGQVIVLGVDGGVVGGYLRVATLIGIHD